jgi:hypothetical protein
MDEPERNYLSQQIQELERSKRRWRLATFTLAAIMVVSLLMSGASFLLVMERNAARIQQALVAERAARQQAEEAAHQLRQKQKAEERQQH